MCNSSRQMVRTTRAACLCRCTSTPSLVSGLVSQPFAFSAAAYNAAFSLPFIFDITALTAHHTTEERHVFPILAKKIPRFAHDAENGHLDSHKAIHDGIWI